MKFRAVGVIALYRHHVVRQFIQVTILPKLLLVAVAIRSLSNLAIAFDAVNQIHYSLGPFYNRTKQFGKQNETSV